MVVNLEGLPGAPFMVTSIRSGPAGRLLAIHDHTQEACGRLRTVCVSLL
jgi:hypothetical protein